MHDSVPLASISVIKEIQESKKLKNGFQICRNDNSNTYSIYCDSRKEKLAWIKDLQDAVEESKSQNH